MICNCLVEDKKESSLEQIQRTKNEIDEQKRLLKLRLEHKIQILSEGLKKPSSIRTRDKVSFTIGVVNACVSPLIGRI